MKVPFVDLKTQYSQIKKEIDTALKKVFNQSQFILGEEVNEFETKFAKYLNVKHCISTASGTDALIIGTRALDIPRGSEMIVPANTFIASALAASFNGLKPVFVDIEEKDYGINHSDLKKKLNQRTKAIMLVHLYGQPDKIEGVKEIIKKAGRKIYLIEDACQAHGAEYKAKKVGGFGIFSAFSFYPSKNLGAYGDGGAVATNDYRLARKIRLLRQYGKRKKYYHELLGFNSRFDTLQAAVLNVKLKYLDAWNKKRQELASFYTKLLNELAPSVKTPNSFAERRSIFHLYVIRAKKRNQLQAFLTKRGVISLIHYPIPLHLQKAYLNLGYKRGDLPSVEKISDQILSLPIYPEMVEQKIQYVVQQISKFYDTFFKPDHSGL